MPRPGFVLDVDRSTPPTLFWRGEGFSLEKLPPDRSRVIYAPEPLHGVRIAAKKLRYAMELAHELRLLSSRRPLRRLERMQDTLGHLHDLQILLERLAAAQAALPVSDSVLAADLAHVSRALDDECRRLHADYVGGRNAMLGAVDDALALVTAGPVRDVETEPVSTSVH